jgi:hypothetical protein
MEMLSSEPAKKRYRVVATSGTGHRMVLKVTGAVSDFSTYELGN